MTDNLTVASIAWPKQGLLYWDAAKSMWWFGELPHGAQLQRSGFWAYDPAKMERKYFYRGEWHDKLPEPLGDGAA